MVHMLLQLDYIKKIMFLLTFSLHSLWQGDKEVFPVTHKKTLINSNIEMSKPGHLCYTIIKVRHFYK